MIEILTANAEKTELQERPAAESLQAAREAGMFRLGTPGHQASATGVARHLSEMGRACPSTAWIAGTCLTSKTLGQVTSGLDTSTLFADPDALFCGSGVPGAGSGIRESAGVRLTGSWPIVSGCEDAAWAGLAATIDGTMSLVYVPADQLRISRTWQMAGMRGTGSHTAVADGVLVPFSLVGTFSGPPTPAMRLLFGLSVLAPVVGATFGALDAVHEMFDSGRKPFMTAYARMNESPAARHWLASATTLAERASRTMYDVAAHAETGDAERLHLHLTEAARDCRDAVELMLDLCGAAGFRTSNRLQRFWRDVAVGSRHPHLNGWLAIEGFGRTVSGL